MKTINETFSDEEHKKLSDKKGNKSWHDFILELVKEDSNGKRKSK